MPLNVLQPTKHKGYAFLEFEEKASADDAVTAMNLFDLGTMVIPMEGLLKEKKLRCYSS